MGISVEAIRMVALGVGLGISAIQDLCTKKLSSLPILLTGLAGIVLAAAGGELKDWHFIFRFIPGFLVLLVAWWTSEGIGYGDAWVILELGCFLPAEETLSVCMAAITIAGFVALFLIVVWHKGKKTQMPFVPFLFGSYFLLQVIK